jgi:oxygen-independent coproporphyrinogen-3 oxidase
VHLPFCEAKCNYCDFFSLPALGQDIDGMIDAVLSEARQRAPRNPRTVFIGGGTPSLLDRGQLERFLVGLDAVTTFRDSATEVTLECNPESLDRDKAALMLDRGVRRLSIGFQSLEAETLKLFGRVHGVQQSFRAFEAARSAGIPDVNVDLIYASPGHAPSSWRMDLQRVLDLAPEHLSAYNLAFEEDTVFSRWLRDGRLQALPEETELEMLSITRELSARAGLESYEISNFARNGHECLHNLNYWANGDYVGLGPSAVSFWSGVRSGNSKGIESYRNAISETGDASAWTESLDPAARLGETWWLGLRRTAGVSPAQARATANYLEGEDPAVEIAARLVELGLLELVGASYRLTDRGRPVADRVSSEFLVIPQSV